MRHVRQADAVILAAAVADAAPARPQSGKLPKERLGSTLRLAPTPDIAASLPRLAGQVRVGFALASNGGRRSALAKLRGKHLDAIVLNGLDSPGADQASFEFLVAGGRNHWARWGRLTKRECARRLIDFIVARFPRATS